MSPSEQDSRAQILVPLSQQRGLISHLKWVVGGGSGHKSIFLKQRKAMVANIATIKVSYCFCSHLST